MRCFARIRYVLIVLTLGYTSHVSSDVGLADVQAICKINLKNGKTLEGAILIATGGYQNYLDTYGFYFLAGDKELAVLFNADFIAIEPWNGVVYMSDGGGKLSSWFKNPKIFFMIDVTSQGETDVKSEIDSSEFFLRRDIIHHFKYKLLDYVPVFTEIPNSLKLNDLSVSAEPKYVRMSEIEKLELLHHPSDKWLKDIADRERAWWKENRDETGESRPPVWFHEIQKNKEQYNLPFKPWNF